VEQTPEPEQVLPPEVAAQVVLSDPDPAWADHYAVERTLIRSALEGELRSVDHAGSTAVPGLAAKPVIDILITVEDPADESAYLPRLESAGYSFRHREPHWHQHRLFKKGEPHLPYDEPRQQPRVNLHVFPDGCEEVLRMLAFRDWLRVDDADRRLYEDTKRALSTRTWGRVQDYADAKTEVVAEIMERALWAQAPKRDGSPAPMRTTSG
jgi:GrpB-like predicted nucleotidyltransferase (UPF0157 family)